MFIIPPNLDYCLSSSNQNNESRKNTNTSYQYAFLTKYLLRKMSSHAFQWSHFLDKSPLTYSNHPTLTTSIEPRIVLGRLNMLHLKLQPNVSFSFHTLFCRNYFDY